MASKGMKLGMKGIQNPAKVGNFESQARARVTISAPSLFSLGDRVGMKHFGYCLGECWVAVLHPRRLSLSWTGQQATAILAFEASKQESRIASCVQNMGQRPRERGCLSFPVLRARLRRRAEALRPGSLKYGIPELENPAHLWGRTQKSQPYGEQG